VCDVPEVLSGLGDSLAVETDSNTTELFIAVGDIEVNLSHTSATTTILPRASAYLVGNLGSLRRLGGLRKEDKCDREDQQESDHESLNGGHDVCSWFPVNWWVLEGLYAAAVPLWRWSREREWCCGETVSIRNVALKIGLAG